MVVLADWHGSAALARLRFFDDNTHAWWDPLTGGCNTPALNELLTPWDITFADSAHSGEYSLDGRAATFASGSVLRTVPSGASVVSALLTDDVSGGAASLLPVLAMREAGKGRVVVYGDSSCVDDAAGLPSDRRCEWLLGHLLEYAITGNIPASLAAVATVLDQNLTLRLPLPAPPRDTLYLYSRVLAGPMAKKPLPQCAQTAWRHATHVTRNSSLALLLAEHYKALPPRAASRELMVSGSAPLLSLTSGSSVLSLVFVLMLSAVALLVSCRRRVCGLAWRLGLGRRARVSSL